MRGPIDRDDLPLEREDLSVDFERFDWMKLRVSDRWKRRARTGFWSLAGLYGVLWLLFVVAMVAGFALGGAETPSEPRTVAADAPPSEVAATAAANLETRNYALEYWHRVRDYNAGTVSGGIDAQILVDHADREVRTKRWFPTTDGVTRRDDAHVSYYGTSMSVWKEYEAPDHWQRHPSNGFNTYGGTHAHQLYSPDRLRETSFTVLGDNESVLVLETAARNLSAGRPGSDENGTVRLVVDRDPVVHLSSVRIRHESNRQTATRLIRVYGYGETDVRRPAAAGPTTYEILRRIGRGLD